MRTAHGLTWSTPFAVAEWAPVDGLADVVVRDGAVPPPPDGASRAGPLRAVHDGSVWFDFPGVARALVSGGTDITLERGSDADDRALAMFLTGPLAAIALHQRGALPMRASAVAVGGRGALVTGAPGAGASSLAAALVTRGADLVSDGLAAVSAATGESPIVLPGTTTIALWRDSAESLGWEVEGCPRTRPGLERFAVPSPRRAEAAAAVAVVYLLVPWNRPEVQLTELRHGERLGPLLDHTAQQMTVKRMGRHGSHFALVAAVAAGARMVRVRWPEGVAIGEGELADRVLEDLVR